MEEISKGNNVENGNKEGENSESPSSSDFQIDKLKDKSQNTEQVQEDAQNKRPFYCPTRTRKSWGTNRMH